MEAFSFGFSFQGAAGALFPVKPFFKGLFTILILVILQITSPTVSLASTSTTFLKNADLDFDIETSGTNTPCTFCHLSNQLNFFL